LGALESDNLNYYNKVGVSLPTLEGGNASSSTNTVFCSYLETRMIDKVHKSLDSESHAPLLKPL
jgi:hypothetical protein